MNVSAIGSDALVVSAAGVRAVSVDALTPEAVMQHAAGFLDAIDALTSGPPAGAASARARMSEVLAWLWHALAEPVLTELGLTRPRRAPGCCPRVWWCPTGLLTFLPLHAAGTSGANTVLDRAVSSYTPGLLALARTRDRARPPAERARLLTVAMRETPGLSPLHGAQEETGPLRRFRGDALKGAAATKAAVTSALGKHAWVHFACHGGQDPSDPSQGRVFLHDHREDPLTVLDIGRLELPDAEFAFLSACETARGGVRLPDESLHLAAALQLAGYAHVIASLWPISDELAIEVSASVYATIESRGGGLDPARSALALHEAVHTLRRSHEHPMLWAAYVHFGP